MSDGFLSENLNFIDFIKKAQNNKRAQILCPMHRYIMTNPSIYSLILIVKFHAEPMFTVVCVFSSVDYSLVGFGRVFCQKIKTKSENSVEMQSEKPKVVINRLKVNFFIIIMRYVLTTDCCGPVRIF